jgi:hypothetical protein
MMIVSFDALEAAGRVRFRVKVVGWESERAEFIPDWLRRE